jgi:hypothetical protein
MRTSVPVFGIEIRINVRGRMDTGSDRAELATLRAQIDELVTRVTAVAQSYDDASDSAIADDLFAAERSLITARRLVDRATGRNDA